MQNRVVQETPTPVNIGQVVEEGAEQLGEGGGWGTSEHEVDLVMLGSVCHRCGGKGHFARECGTPPEKGKGKGERGAKSGKIRKGGFGKGDFGKSSKGHFAKGDFGREKKKEKGKGRGSIMGKAA